MVLKKVDTGHFKGAARKTAHLTLEARDASVAVQILSVVYGETAIDHQDTAFDLKLAKGEQALVVVYACTDTVFVDLWEVDQDGRQKLKSDKFLPSEPYLSIWVEGE